MNKRLLQGNLLDNSFPPIINGDVRVSFNGTIHGNPSSFNIDSDILSKHMMLIGGTGCGKTNTFFHIVNQIKYNLSPNDVMIIFDTKGDYFNRFYNSYNDLVLTTSEKYNDISIKWNIFREILIDGIEDNKVKENINEITYGLFNDSISKNNSNPFFPNAARDLFASILTCIYRKTGNDPRLINSYLNNKFLKKFLDMLNSKGIHDLLKDQSDQISVLSYIGKGDNDQGLGVIAELQTVVRQIFVGDFAEEGNFSIRDFIRQKGGKTLFIEYDLTRGSTLTPIYRLLIDLALKEGMNRETDQGNVYVFCDEFKLLPDLVHIENAVNFGRSLGLKIFAGLQSIDQITESYGEARGKNIIAGFSSVFSFRANDEQTRKFTVGKYGTNQILEQYDFTNVEKRIGNVVEDWDLMRLDTGEAIVGLIGYAPFRFRFELYR